MPAYIKIDGIPGESTDDGHKDWIIIESLSSPINRTVNRAKDQMRASGETVLGDVVVTRLLDKSSPKLAEYCANGKFIPEVKVDLCTTVNGKQQPKYTYTLKDVIITGYSFHGVATADPPPSEEVSFNFREIEWNYTVMDNNTGDKKGQVVGSYNPSKGK